MRAVSAGAPVQLGHARIPECFWMIFGCSLSAVFFFFFFPVELNAPGLFCMSVYFIDFPTTVAWKAPQTLFLSLKSISVLLGAVDNTFPGSRLEESDLINCQRKKNIQSESLNELIICLLLKAINMIAALLVK